MNDAHFIEIDISGFRGRFFNLKMKPRGKHTVFIMDGNTGKTTTIELLRWCFKHVESKSLNKFQHMWYENAYVLDHNILGQQTCKIEIIFSAMEGELESHFRFKREVKGEYIKGYDKTDEKIEYIKDILDIDNGREILDGDKALNKLTELFRFNDCAEYFCFDGEKAREIMQLTSNSDKIRQLLEIINTRVTNKKIYDLKEQLINLRDRIYSETKSRTTDRSIQNNINTLTTLQNDNKYDTRRLNDLTAEKKAFDFLIQNGDEEYKNLESQIESTKQQNLIQTIRLNKDLEINELKIKAKRNEIYLNTSEWVIYEPEIIELVNKIKLNIRETGKLPEPYRMDLINACLKYNKCQICNRDLTDDLKEHVKKLGLQIASTEVQAYLSNDINLPLSNKVPLEIMNNVNTLFTERQTFNTTLKAIQLTKEDTEKINKMNSIKSDIEIYKSRREETLKTMGIFETSIKERTEEINILENKIMILQENKIILDKITESLKNIDKAEDQIKNRVLNIISDVISEGVKSILGPSFSAKLSLEDGLMLGEDNFYGKERGGYSGRLILSYCFAEAMTLIDPIIVDTPSGNIGSHREALAQHLARNHKQVILLCLPTEVEKFAPYISEDIITIVNGKGENK
jgi:hypothetical protein